MFFIPPFVCGGRGLPKHTGEVAKTQTPEPMAELRPSAKSEVVDCRPVGVETRPTSYSETEPQGDPSVCRD